MHDVRRRGLKRALHPGHVLELRWADSIERDELSRRQVGRTGVITTGTDHADVLLAERDLPRQRQGGRADSARRLAEVPGKESDVQDGSLKWRNRVLG